MPQSSELRAQWREPTSLLRLNWGSYRERYLAGLTLIVGGGIHLLGSNVWTLNFLLIGTVAHAAGWAILPAAGWRRLTAIAPSIAMVWILLTGPQALWALTIGLAMWLLVRHRPLRSYLTVLFPLVTGIAIAQYFRELSGMPVALPLALAVTIASAWIARVIAASAPIPGKTPASIR